MSHLRGTQHSHKRYDWDARLLFGNEELDVPIQSYVPMKRRKPCVSLRMAKVITKRLTTMIFGHDRFPTICIDGDSEAEDYIREIAKVAKLRTKMVEARDKGGATGTVILSWGFAEGKPVVDVHSSALVEVLEWADYENRVPAKVLKAYDFRKRVFRDDGKPEDKTFWSVRYWDTNIDRSWEPIPDEIAQSAGWQAWPSSTIVHGHGKCPLVWVQNIPDGDDIDGVCDADGQHEDFDEMDRLASATERGTILNVDPTLVIKDRKGKAETIVRKGSGHVIYSPGGAQYLELQGQAVEAAKSLLTTIKQTELDEAEVVLLDPEKLSGAGVSAASLKVRYMAMLAKCDVLRDQYGEAMVEVLKAMLETARQLSTPVPTDEGVRTWSHVELAPRIDDGVEIERTPGSSSNVHLKWPPYFPATWEDRRIGVETATKATGGKQVMAQRTAIELIAPMMDVESVDKELERIEEDQETANNRAKALLDAGAPPFQPAQPPPPGGNEEDDEDEEDDG